MADEIAWIGTGLMGAPMVDRLLDAGRSVAVWNRTPARADALVARGAGRLATLAEAGGHDIVMTMVLDDTALASVHGESGLLSEVVSTSLWIDCSTVSPEAAAEAAAAAASRGVAYVSAPVSGNPITVVSGRALFAISGDDEVALGRAESVLLDIGRGVQRVGGGASAAVVKVAVNALLAVTMQSLAESVVLAEARGVSRRAFLDFLKDSAIGSPFIGYKSDAIVNLDFSPTMFPASQLKDVRLGLAAASLVGVPTPVLLAAEGAYQRLAESDYGADLDIAALVLQTARDAGLELRPEDA
jgi:3-hydroxyisobutyrate dehydrogenase